ncbi:hypothetical protein D9757_005912 [Collybiopsis confluens]|uniref:Uncharacterized protein n=1 Tax=Collybiopsis confluens TaxID=2823264 RepID=A0A8H5HNA1_9AGAR|nr:hypothetical protein D9757_005912 [Collybiopsis confluens]
MARATESANLAFHCSIRTIYAPRAGTSLLAAGEFPSEVLSNASMPLADELEAIERSSDGIAA